MARRSREARVALEEGTAARRGVAQRSSAASSPLPLGATMQQAYEMEGFRLRKFSGSPNGFTTGALKKKHRKIN